MSPDWPLAQYRLRRQGGRFRRRYVVMGISSNGALEWEWEWEPLTKHQVFRRLGAAGHFVTDIWPLLDAADEEAKISR
jgi:hypothetical protein